MVGEALLQTPEQIVPCSPWSHHTGEEEKCEEKGAVKRNYFELATGPIPIPLHPLWGEAEDLWMKEWSRACEETWKEGGFFVP